MRETNLSFRDTLPKFYRELGNFDIVEQFSEAPRSMRDKMSQLKGEIGEKTSWDSKYCSELFHRR